MQILFSLKLLRVVLKSKSISLREQLKGPTAVSCADGKMSGLSAQHEARGG
jgi:hypothetical protein